MKLEVGNVSDREKKLLAIVGSVAVLFCGWYFLISPKLDSVSKLSTQVSDDKVKRDDLKKKFEKIDDLKKELAKNKKELAKFSKEIPENIKIEDAIDKLDNIFTKSGVNFKKSGSITVQDIIAYQAPTTTTTATTVAPPAGFYKVSLTVSVKGAYNNILHMFQGIEKCDLKMNPSTVAITSTNDKDGLTANYTIDLYTYNPQGKALELKPLDSKKIPSSGETNIFSYDISTGTFTPVPVVVQSTIQPTQTATTGSTGGNVVNPPSFAV